MALFVSHLAFDSSLFQWENLHKHRSCIAHAPMGSSLHCSVSNPFQFLNAVCTPNKRRQGLTGCTFLLHSGNVSFGCRAVKTEDDTNVSAAPLPPFMAQPDYGSSTPLDALPSATAEHSPQNSRVKEERLEPPPPGTEVMGPLPRPSSLTNLQAYESG